MSDSPEKDGAARKLLTNGQVFGFIARQWMRRPGMFLLVAGLMAVTVGFDMAIPWMASGLVKAVSADPHRGLTQAWRAWGLLAGTYFTFFSLRILAMTLWNPFAARNMEILSNEAFARVQSFSADWHADTFAGATVRRVSRAMWGYDTVSDQAILWLGPSLLVLTGLCVTMALRWPVLGGVAMATVALYVGVTLFLAQTYVRPANLKSAAMDSEIGAVLADALGSNPAVKSFGAEAREVDRFAQTTAAWRTVTANTWQRGMVMWGAQNVVTMLLQAGLTGTLVWLWSRGRADASDVAFAIAAYMVMHGYLRSFGENVRNLQKGMDDTEAVAGYMTTAPQVRDRPDASVFCPGPGTIAFDRVTFRYKSHSRRIFEDLSLSIAPGERLALVGHTGSGKSTFVKLIQRLYDLEAGRILIDGQDVARMTQASLRRAIALVPQDPALFHRSLAENISYGRPGASLDEIIACAKRARAHDFITKLPKGYDTLVGERGVKLSGGERQRVAIARAFLADAPILILDEATSSLDVETERLVQAAAEELMEGRTTIVIAHRLSTVRGADRILVFDEGRIVEEGPHVVLAAAKGPYARLNAIAEGVV